MAISYNDGKGVTLDGVDLDGWLVDLEIKEMGAATDVSTQGVANKVYARGKPDYEYVATFLQDDAVAAVDATIRANLTGTYAGVFTGKGGNPTHTVTVMLGDYTSVPSGRGDDFREISCTFKPAGAAVIT